MAINCSIYVSGMCLVAFLANHVPLECHSTPWHVSKDGQGDYSVIQEAVDIAAPGDTIFIGEGRYDEGQIITRYGIDEFCHVLVDVDDLTFIGDSSGSTIIGPQDPWQQEDGYTYGIVCGDDYGSISARVIGIQFENMREGIKIEDSNVLIESCSFSHNAISIFGVQGEMDIQSSVFNYTCLGYEHIFSWYQDDMNVQGCEFVLYDVYQWVQGHIHLEGTTESTIESCIFHDGRDGVSVSYSQASIRHCSFDGLSSNSFVNMSGSSMFINDCTINGGIYPLESNSPNVRWEVNRVEISNAVNSSLRYRDPLLGYISDCILSKGRYFTIERRGDSLVSESHYDMTDNWWGTSDPDSIEAWILDATDLPVTGQIIDWYPYKTEPIQTEKKSMGDIKGMFR